MKLIYALMTVTLAAASAQATAQSPAAAAPTAVRTAGSSKVFRVTYTMTETDAGKRLGVQHYSLVLTEGGRSTLKNGSKVPVATGSYAAGGGAPNGVQTQFTYLDVGTNLDTTLGSALNGAWNVKTKVEQSSVGEERTIAGVNEPVVRQSVFEAVTSLTVGKPQVLGTLDITGSTRHLEIEVLLEPVN